MAVLIVPFLVFAVVAGETETGSGSFRIFLSGVPFLIFLVFVLAYFFCLESLSGQTLGKRWIGLEVVDASGATPGTRAIAIRTVLRLIDWLPFFYIVGFFSMLGKQSLRLGDRAAKTSVRIEPLKTQAPVPLGKAWGNLAAIGILTLLLAAAASGSEEHPSPTDPDFDPSPTAVAKLASESDVTVPDEVPAGVYPPAPSTAVGMTTEWREFADAVDGICALTYNYMQAQEVRAGRQAAAEGWSHSRASATHWEISAAQGTQIVEATAELGEPPAEAALFERWRANVALRRDLKLKAAAAAGRSDWNLLAAIDSQVGQLKDQSDEIGQRFGLRICTSN